MAQKNINIGTSANKGDGEPLRTAFNKINENFTELYNTVIGDSKGSVFGDDSTTLVDAVNSSINLDGTVKGNIIPDVNVAYDIGSSTKRFKDLWLQGTTINLGTASLSANAAGGINLPANSSIPGVVERLSKPASILDTRGVETYYNPGDPALAGSTIIDQATWTNSDVGARYPTFKPSVYSATIDGSGNITDITLDTANYYLPDGIQDWSTINSDNMYALDPGININNPDDIRASQQFVVLLASVVSTTESVNQQDSLTIDGLEIVNVGLNTTALQKTLTDPTGDTRGSAITISDSSLAIINYQDPVGDQNRLQVGISLGGSQATLQSTIETLAGTQFGKVIVDTGRIQLQVDATGSTPKEYLIESDGITFPNGAVIKDNSNDSIAFGGGAGASSQGGSAVAVGEGAGNNTQGNQAIAVGRGSGNYQQGVGAVGVGFCAGATTQGDYAVAIGFKAARGNMDNDGTPNQPANSIMINASSTPLNGDQAGLYINPVREDVANTTKAVYYNTTTKELTYANPTGGSGDGANLVSDNDINLTINSPDSTSYSWNFDQLGFIRVPAVDNQLGGVIGDIFEENMIGIQANPNDINSYASLVSHDKQNAIDANKDGITILTDDSFQGGSQTKEWNFERNGNLRFPDNTVQTTAYTGLNWGNITGTPTTLSGYGITDAIQNGDTFTGDVKGSVFADDSTILVDAVAGLITGTIQNNNISFDTDLNLQFSNTGKINLQSNTVINITSNANVTGYNWQFDDAGGFVLPTFSQNESGPNPGTTERNVQILNNSGYAKFNFAGSDWDADVGSASAFDYNILVGSYGIRLDNAPDGSDFTIRNNVVGGNIDIGANAGSLGNYENGGNINIFAGENVGSGTGGKVIINSNGGDIFLGPLANTLDIRIGGGPGYAGTNDAYFYGNVNFAVGSVLDFTGTTATGLTAPYTATTSTDWNGTPPTTVGDALDRLAAVVKILNGGTGA